MTGIPDDPDEATLWAGRLRAWPAAEPADAEGDADADDTRLVRLSEPADETVIAARRSLPDETVARPRGSVGAADPVEEGTVLRPRTDAPADPVRPVTRREASGRIAAPADTPRNASVPTGAEREIYKPRAAEPVIVTRQAPPRVAGAGGPAPDAASAARRERAARRRAVTVVVVAAVVALVAAAAIVALLVL